MKPHLKALAKLSNKLPAESYFRNGVTDLSKNPVYVSFNKDYSEICSLLSSKKTVDSTRKLDNMLSSLWNNFEDRLPCDFVQIKMIELGKYLTSKKEHNTAICHCYDRMLMKWFSWIQKIDFDNLRDFLEAFPRQEFKHPACLRSLEAVMGRLVCRYGIVFDVDPDLLSPHALLECLRVMRSFHVIMSSLFLVKDLQYFIHKITIHIFSMFRHMMLLGHTSRVINYLEFCVQCIDSSCHLDWNSTMTFVLCQGYYRIGFHTKAEAHARRFLLFLDRSKDDIINKSLQPDECAMHLRVAAIKMALVVFRRCVFESRRRPAGFMKPCNKLNIKEVAHLSWPRTQTESLLSSMFEGSSAQFMAIMMTLSDSRERILITPPAVVANEEEDVEMADVYNELFFAAEEIISGGGGNKGASFEENLNLKGRMMAGVVKQQPLFELSKQGRNGVCLSDVVDFVKLAFNYEKFEIFNIWIHKILCVLQESEETIHKKLILELEVVKLVDKITMRQGAGKNNPEQLYFGIEQDLLCLVEILIQYVKQFYNQKDVTIDMYLLLDASKTIWMKCRKFIHPQSPDIILNSKESLTRILKLIEANWILFKWVELMMKMKDLFEMSSIENHEPLMVAELCLTLALIVESLSCYFPENQHDPGVVHNFKDLTKNSEDFLCNSYHILEDGIVMISCARCFVSTDADFDAIQSFKEFESKQDELSGEKMKLQYEELKTDLRDIHTEMMFHFTRISMKMSHFRSQSGPNKILKCTHLARSFQFMVDATFLPSNNAETQSRRRELLNKASSLMCKMEREDEALGYLNCAPSNTLEPPILLNRSDNSLSFMARQFVPQDGSMIIYYKLFGRPVTPTNKSAMLIDTNLPGCGVAISPFKAVFHVTGLTHGQRYVFALGAFDCKGNLIGGKVGRSTSPIVVSHPMSDLLAWSHLCKVAHDLCCFDTFVEASGKIWKHYVCQPHMIDECRHEVEDGIQFHLSNYCLNHDLIMRSSDIQRQMLFMVMMMMTEYENERLGLKGSNLCDITTSKNNQIVRLQVCEKATVPILLSKLIENPLSCLEAVLHCYGILTPLIFQRILNEDVIAIMISCLRGLESVPGKIRCLRGSEGYRVISGIITCLCYHVARYMRKQGSFGEADKYIELGQNLLKPNYEANLQCSNKSNSSSNLKMVSHQVNSSTSRKLKGAILLKHLSSSKAYKEIQELKGIQPARYLELLVKVCQKGLMEKEYDNVLLWCSALDNLFAKSRLTCQRKSNEELNKNDIKKRGKTNKSQSTIRIDEKSEADDAKFYEISDYLCPNLKSKVDNITWLKKKKKLELPAIKDSSAEERRKNKLAELADALTVSFLPYHKEMIARKKFRVVAKGQSECRSMMNLIKGLVQLNLFLKKYPLNKSNSNSNCFRKLSIIEDHCHIENSSFICFPPKLSPPKDDKQTTPSFISASTDSIKGKGETKARKVDSNQGRKKEREEKNDISSKGEADIRDCIRSLNRAIVLSHRYGHWIILQNSCIHFWNMIQRMQELFHAFVPTMVSSSSLSFDGLHVQLPLTYDEFRAVTSLLMYQASDYLLDMILDLQRNEGCSSPLKNWLSCLPICHYGNYYWDGKFDFPRDDGSVVNLKFIEKFVLRSIETLCSLNKWEKAAHLSFKFTAITGPRFADLLGPIILLCQRKLTERIEKNGGLPKCQPHLEAAVSRNNNTAISCIDYCSMNLVVHSFPNKGSSAKRSLQLSSVPLDVCSTQDEFEGLISQIPFPVRSLRHSRKLLALHFLGVLDVEIVPQLPTRAIPTVLPDKPKEQLLFHPFPSQSFDLVKVLASYGKTMYAIKCDKNLGCLFSQCLLEFSILHLYNGEHKKSKKLWMECIDNLIMTDNFIECEEDDLMKCICKLRAQTSNKLCITNIKERQSQGTLVFPQSDDLAIILLEACGVWNCINGSIALYHLAKFIFNDDLSNQVKCCLLAASFLKALLRTSLLFPVQDCKYSSPRMRQLLDIHFLRGLYIFEDIHQCNPEIFLTALWCISKSLHRTQYNAMCLPLVTMHEHFVLKTWNDTRPYVMNQVLRVRLLLNMNLMTEAIDLLLRLFTEANIPGVFDRACDNGDEEDDGDCANEEDNPNANVPRFKCFEKIYEENNVKVIESVILANLSPDMMERYGYLISRYLYLLKAELLVHISGFHMAFISCSEAQKTGDESGKHKKSSTNVKEIEGHTLTDVADELKKKMLEAAQDILRPIMENVITNETLTGLENIFSSLTLFEFELFVRAKLLISRIQKQRHQHKLAAKTISSTMKMINMFLHLKSKSAKENPEDGYLDTHLWSACLLEIVDCLLLDIESYHSIDVWKLKTKLRAEQLKLGQKDQIYMWSKFPLDPAGICKEGLKFSESSKDWHMQVQFLFRGVLLHAFKGTPVSRTLQLLQEIECILNRHSILPDTIRSLLFKVRLLRVDISILMNRRLPGSVRSQASSTEFWLQRAEECKSAELIICHELCSSSETSGSEKEGNKSMRNVYLSSHRLIPLSKIRRGHSMAILATLPSFSLLQSIEILEQSLDEFLMAYEYACSSAVENHLIVLEILLNIACVIRQVSVTVGNFDIICPANYLFQVLKINATHFHKHSITKEAFMELVLLCLSASYHSKLKENKKSSEAYDAAATAILEFTVQYISSRNEFMNKSMVDDFYYSKVKDSAKQQTPAFVALDIFGSTVFQMPEFYASISPLEDSDILLGETLEKNNKRVQELSCLLTWRDLLDYQNNLLRLFSNEQLVNTVSDDVESSNQNPGHNDSVHQFLPYLSPNPVDLPIFSDLWGSKLETLNQFLSQNIPGYEEYIGNVLPGKNLWNILKNASDSENLCSTKETPTIKTAKKMFNSVKQQIIEGPHQADLVDETPKNISSRESVTETEDKLSLMWYTPRFVNLNSQGEQALFVLYLLRDGQGLMPGKIITTANRLLMVKHCIMHYSESYGSASNFGSNQSEMPQDQKQSTEMETKAYSLQEDLLICYTKPLIEKVIYILKN